MKRIKKKKKKEEEEEDEEEDDHNPNSTHIFSMGCAPGEVLNLTVDTSPFATAKSAADALRIAFQVYSQRPCLGACPKAPQLGCNWHSYCQVGQASEALAAGIRQVLENQGKPNGQIVAGCF
jgi:hypothetical protein